VIAQLIDPTPCRLCLYSKSVNSDPCKHPALLPQLPDAKLITSLTLLVSAPAVQRSPTLNPLPILLGSDLVAYVRLSK